MMLTRVCALAESDVRVNAVAPGAIRTGIGSGNDLETVDVVDADVSAPIGRRSGPEEVVGADLSLASNEASYVTGYRLAVGADYTIV